MTSNGHDHEPAEDAAARVFLVPISGDEMGNLAYRDTVDAVVQRWHAETGRPRSAT